MIKADACYRNYDPHVMAVGVVEAPLPATDPNYVVKPEKIFVQTPSTNDASVFIGRTGIQADFSVGGYELPPGGSMYLPGHMVADWRAIAAVAGQKLLVTYLSGVF